MQTLARMRRPLNRAARLGFTLIELLAVLVIIGILAMFLIPNVIGAFDAAEVQACNSNLSEIYKSMMIFKSKYDRGPNQSGVRFFAELYSMGCMDPTEKSARRLTCPGVEDSVLGQVAMGLEPEEWFRDLELVDGTFSTYAGRDCEHFPLRKFPPRGGEPLVADDNDGGMNHDTTTNVLLGDGSVETFEIFELKSEGLVEEEEEILFVGPESPVEKLRKLSLD